MERRNGLVCAQARSASAGAVCDPSLPLPLRSLVVRRATSARAATAPSGSVGVITHVFAHGVGYEVRFSEPGRVTLCASRPRA